MFNGINQRIFMSVSMFGAPTPTVDWNTRPKPKNKSAKSKARSARAEFGSGPVKKGKGVRSLLGRLNCCLREPEVETDSLDAMERGEALDVVDVDSVEIKTSPQQSGGSSSCPATTPSPGDDQQSRQSSTPSTEDGKANEGKRRPSGLAKKGGLGGPFRRACGYLRDFWNKGSRTPMPPGGPPGFYEVANGSCFILDLQVPLSLKRSPQIPTWRPTILLQASLDQQNIVERGQPGEREAPRRGTGGRQ
ncbi:uncharacterized protein LOC119734554 [Patiria miniata]|uniref:Uncharacterized protein n=1 Tax=Patiria miniata TaxID=46514 RepID=A0A914AJV8_PATMI|nr:uncharacterized protein LOC119734554 [Patiria miniata]